MTDSPPDFFSGPVVQRCTHQDLISYHKPLGSML